MAMNKISKRKEVIEIEIVEHDALYRCVAELLSIYGQFGDRSNAIDNSRGLGEVEKFIGLDHVLRVLDNIDDKKDKESVAVNHEALASKISIKGVTAQILTGKEIQLRLREALYDIINEVQFTDYNIDAIGVDIRFIDYIDDDYSESQNKNIMTRIKNKMEESLQVQFEIEHNDFKVLTVDDLVKALSIAVGKYTYNKSMKAKGKSAKFPKKKPKKA